MWAMVLVVQALRWTLNHASSVQFSSVQDGIYALGKIHTRSTPSLGVFPNVSLETVPMLVYVWLTVEPFSSSPGRSLSAFSGEFPQCCPWNSSRLLLFLSYPVLLSVYFPDYFFPKPPFSALLCGSCLGFFERLGDEYFSWWYVQSMLPYVTGISLYIYTVFFICNCFCPFFWIIFFICYWNARPKQSMVPASLNFTCHVFMRAIPKGLTLGLCLLYVLCL